MALKAPVLPDIKKFRTSPVDALAEIRTSLSTTMADVESNLPANVQGPLASARNNVSGKLADAEIKVATTAPKLPELPNIFKGTTSTSAGLPRDIGKRGMLELPNPSPGPIGSRGML
jgi:hypothetical protein